MFVLKNSTVTLNCSFFRYTSKKCGEGRSFHSIMSKYCYLSTLHRITKAPCIITKGFHPKI
nr:MAG TPA: hypothetical protein [Caudoviricetes sp.]